MDRRLLAPGAESLIEKDIHVKLPTSLYDAVQDLARETDRPVAREIRAALRNHVERHREVTAPNK
jgi:predicted transcriptional regulator